jgi:hypothetical protein
VQTLEKQKAQKLRNRYNNLLADPSPINRKKAGLFSFINDWKIIIEAPTGKIRRSRNQGMTLGISPRNTMEYYEF